MAEDLSLLETPLFTNNFSFILRNIFNSSRRQQNWDLLFGYFLPSLNSDNPFLGILSGQKVLFPVYIQSLSQCDEST